MVFFPLSVSLIGFDVDSMMFILFSVDGYKITYHNLNQTLIFVKDSIISTHVFTTSSFRPPPCRPFHLRLSIS